MKTEYDVLGLGNAIIDIIASTTDSLLEQFEIRKGGMTLIDEIRAEEITEAVRSNWRRIPGGSAANTIAGVSSFGGRSAYIGKVYNDDLGRFFEREMHKIGVTFNTRPLMKGPTTARSIILVTPRWRALHEHLPWRLYLFH